MPSPAQLRADIARAERDGHKERADEVRREYYAQELERHITAVVAKAPPLTDEQLEKLRRALAPVSAGGVAA